MKSSRRLISLLVAGATALATTAAWAVSSAVAAPPAVKALSTPASLVNPIIGTSGQVNTFPGADVPFGMMQWSPDTSPNRTPGGGYEYNDSRVSGFSLTHISGPGCNASGDIPILPFVGDPGSNPADATASFSHTQETAKAGYYKVVTGSGDTAVTSALTTTVHAGIAQFGFPSSSASHILVKLAGSASTVDGTSVSVVGDRELTGSVTSGHFCSQSGDLENDYTLHFDLKFNQPFTAATVGSAKNPSTEVLTFDTTTHRQVTAKVGISYTDAGNASNNLATEIPDWNLATVRSAATAAWNKILGRIEIGGGTRTQQVQFYTALYHSLIHPNVFSDASGDYRGMDGKIHTIASGHAQYANYSGWDTYRSQVPLAALVAPDQTSDAVSSMLTDYDQSGRMPKWALNNGESYVMVGDPADAIIGDAYAFGARGFDTSHALDVMIAEAPQTNKIRPGQNVRDVKGYLPVDGSYGCCNFYGATATQLEYDSADYSIASFANALGNRSVYTQFASRAQDWQNVFNPATGYTGAKLANGQWAPGFTPGTSNGMVEGTAAQYTAMVPHNLKGLIAARGGNSAYSKYLDGMFSSIANPTGTGADLSNEPSIEIPWEYDWVGQPWKTQSVVRQAQQQLYFDKPVGQFGNDDLGAMSSWYVWSVLGFYPEIPGTPTLAIGSPALPLAQVHLGNGRTWTIAAPNAAPDAPYVHGVTVNGRAWAKPWTTYAQIASGPVTSFDLGTTPDKAWGSSAEAAPPSDATGESPVFTSASPSTVVLQPGKSSTATIQVRNISKAARTVNWTATAEKGVQLSPSHGTVKVGAGATATAKVKVTAGASSDGRYTIGIDFRLANGTALSSSSIFVAVAEPGDLWPYYSNAGISDDDNTSAANFDGGGWSYSSKALAAEGIKPGSSIGSDGLTYSWPDVPAATMDNIEMSGQTIALKVPSTATSIGLLGSATNAGSQGAGGTVVVHYSDGTTSDFQARFSDWTLGGGSGSPVQGDTTVAKMPYRNVSGNKQDSVKTYLFAVHADLTAGKQVTSITLPDATGGDAHVFAFGFNGTGASVMQRKATSAQHMPAAPRIAPAPGRAMPSPIPVRP